MDHLQLDYVAIEDLAQWLLAQSASASARQILGATLYGACARELPWPGVMAEWHWPRVNLPVLDGGTAAWAEVWSVAAGLSGTSGVEGQAVPVRHGVYPSATQTESEAVNYACSDALMFAWLSLPLRASNPDLAQTSTRAYQALFTAIQAVGYPHPLRFWNYLPDILGTAEVEERYRVFNQGRHAAFVQHAAAIENSPPAACALGHPGAPAGAAADPAEPLTVFVIASRQAGWPIENPRQTSAYRYPPQYGRQSPTFSRATLSGTGPDATLFISGTASIVGHATLHVGDVRAQTHETLDNIEALLGEVSTRNPGMAGSLSQLPLKVYVRDAADLSAVREVIMQRLGPRARCHYLQATVCRPDLLVEIEACATLRDGLSYTPSTLLSA
jgi:chorismate lyase/3-hydroxybenzoate synthase